MPGSPPPYNPQGFTIYGEFLGELLLKVLKLLLAITEIID